jgi:hypothetical protein
MFLFHTIIFVWVSIHGSLGMGPSVPRPPKERGRPAKSEFSANAYKR